MGDKDRHYFILTDKQLSAIQPANPSPLRADWLSRIFRLKKTHIYLSDESNVTLRGKIKDISDQILALRAEVIERWLAF